MKNSIFAFKNVELKMKSIPLYKFVKRKYGSELLVDVIPIDDMKQNIERTPVLSENFYSIMLVLRGHEEVAVNERSAEVDAGNVICGAPGDVWKFTQDSKLEGYNLIFEEEFLLSFFNDPHFLRKLSYLNPHRPSPVLLLPEDLQTRICGLYEQMRHEIANNGGEKDQHILRAMLYETLMLLNRADQTEYEVASNSMTTNRYVESFVKLVNSDFAAQHGIEYYADKLCITPNYLNKIVRQSLGTTPKLYIVDKILQEAKRLLRYTDLTVTEIADRLCFENASYFIRYFRKQVGCTPLQFRKRQQD